MKSAKTYVKLGLFTILGVAALLATAVGLGIRSVRPETVRYHSYFDESVQGLEIGSPVKYRGVSIGSVAAVQIAPDRRHVDVSLALKVDDIRRLGLAVPDARGVLQSGEPTRIVVPPDLRAQLGSQGITGVKFVNIDFFDQKANPVAPLPFAADPDTIPAAASLMKGVEDSLARVLERLPALLDGTLASLGKVDRILDDFQAQQIPASLSKTLTNLNGAVTDLRVAVEHVDQAKLGALAAKAIGDMDQTALKVNAILERFDGDAGLVASTQRATNSVGDLSKRVTWSTGELDHTLRDLGEAARAVRDLAEAIERDPDMLVKGRAAVKAP